ncbi:hypothetical protein LCGC14_0773760 [marine sediment metagenome]|uniref:Uncharacterized protein n=1 Tax=marine sediment metagenome TaxID=412755 RepID=A0A0F9Q1Q3_9ZZZZ
MIGTAYDRDRNERRGTTKRINPQPFTISNKEFIDKVMHPNSDARIDAKLKFNSTDSLDRGQQISIEEFDCKTKTMKEIFYKIALKTGAMSGFKYVCEEV